MPDEPRARWFGFIAQRRRYVSDLAWYGLGCVVVGVDMLVELTDLLRWLGLAIALVGTVMVTLDVRRRLRSFR